METVMEPITKLTRDIRSASTTLGPREVRYIVDSYYKMQDDRKRAASQVAAMADADEPHVVIQWLFDQSKTLENQLKSALGAYSMSTRIGRWSRSICGIGPVIAAGLEAHIDIEKAPTVGHIWRFAGLDPTVAWGKGQKRPWNASLKVLCWKIGESFVLVQSKESDIYGKVYAVRKEQEESKNIAGDFAEQAAAVLSSKKIGKTTEAFKHYSAGRLPPAHIHARAKRYAVKLFLSHWHEIAYRSRFGEAPPKPYIIEHGGHVHFIKPPNMEIE